eukprot:361970-Chlamydomonas_euryale.AAC.5
MSTFSPCLPLTSKLPMHTRPHVHLQPLPAPDKQAPPCTHDPMSTFSPCLPLTSKLSHAHTTPCPPRLPTQHSHFLTSSACPLPGRKTLDSVGAADSIIEALDMAAHEVQRHGDAEKDAARARARAIEAGAGAKAADKAAREAAARSAPPNPLMLGLRCVGPSAVPPHLPLLV